MTYESYIEQVMSNNPEFVAQMNERVAREYSSQIAATKAEFDSRMEEARAAWIKNRGEDVYNQNADTIRSHLNLRSRSSATSKTLNSTVINLMWKSIC